MSTASPELCTLSKVCVPFGKRGQYPKGTGDSIPQNIRRALKVGWALALLLLALPVQARELRVCSDPNNLPFSNQAGEGFENRIAEMLAGELGAELKYTWWAQRRGFVRNTLKAGQCDLIIGVPSSFDMVLATAPYYRSTYVFVSRAGAADPVGSFDDPRLRQLKIGVQLVGDDYANPPAAHALGRRGITGNVIGYPVYGDYRDAAPTAAIVDAVARGAVDVAVVWGPQAGYFAKRSKVRLALVPVSPQIDLPFLPFVFDIAMGVRRGEDAFRGEIDAVLERRRAEIDKILSEYGVPLVRGGMVAAR
ncbi:MAG TPA: substrate-binding domain-containing protein [Terriglobales bacterium]|nr:substrate-binding domain-containing protein [Terriglobales bacterium]